MTDNQIQALIDTFWKTLEKFEMFQYDGEVKLKSTQGSKVALSYKNELERIRGILSDEGLLI